MPDISPAHFWDRLAAHGQATALTEAHGLRRSISYTELLHSAGQMADRLELSPVRKQVILLAAANSIPAVAVYLAALRQQQVIFPFGQGVDSPLFAELTDRFAPDLLVIPADATVPDAIDVCYRRRDTGDGLAVLCRRESAPAMSPPHPDLALLLTTSGSTGNPKLVRISAAALAANACQIVSALEMDATDRAITTLSMAYSFGLSVINSHLLAGGSLVLADRSPLDPDFWTIMAENRVTTFPGVPFSYDLLRRTGADQKAPSCLRKLLQAGGRMSPQMTEWTRKAFPQAPLYVMYGQTEATARLSVLPPADAAAGHGSVGYPLDGGTFSFDEQGQVIYQGPNVMMGYACDRAGLAAEDQLQGRLETGDLGQTDDAGRLWLTGRLSRIAKPFGVRVSLDDFERALAPLGTLAVGGDDTVIRVFVEAGDREVIAAKAKELAQSLKLPVSVVRVQATDALPRGSSGKILYAGLK